MIINYLKYNYRFDQANNPRPIDFSEFSEEENNIIENVVKSMNGDCFSVDKTHSPHSKNLTKNRNKDRKLKWQEV